MNIRHFTTMTRHLFVCAFLTMIVISASPAYSKLIDKVVAVVNNDVITLSELNAEAEQITKKIISETQLDEQEETIYAARESALNSLIDKSLIRQKAKESRVSVSEQEVTGTINGIRKKAGLTVEEFNKELIKSGLSPKLYSANIRSQLLQRKIVNYDIRSRIVIPESAIKTYYDKEYISQAAADEFFLLQLGINWVEGDRQKTKKQIERVRALAISGQDFIQLVKKFSTLPSMQDGGDIGSFTIDDMSASMAEAIAPLKPGQLSKIIETAGAYQFFKVLSGGKKQTVIKEPYDMVKEQIRARLFEIKMQEKFQEWLKELKDDAYIQKI
ncbi:MAG: SurA N-terminal domain-containing protein [Desulfotalea sp.]